jgi:hypothetical protein
MIELRHLNTKSRDCNPTLFGHRISVSEGFTGVIRVANEIRIKEADLLQFRAFPEVDSTWSIEFVCTGSPHQMELLRKRMYRIPTVMRIHCWHVDSRPA